MLLEGRYEEVATQAGPRIFLRSFLQYYLAQTKLCLDSQQRAVSAFSVSRPLMRTIRGSGCSGIPTFACRIRRQSRNLGCSCGLTAC